MLHGGFGVFVVMCSVCCSQNKVSGPIDKAQLFSSQNLDYQVPSNSGFFATLPTALIGELHAQTQTGHSSFGESWF